MRKKRRKDLETGPQRVCHVMANSAASQALQSEPTDSDRDHDERLDFPMEADGRPSSQTGTTQSICCGAELAKKKFIRVSHVSATVGRSAQSDQLRAGGSLRCASWSHTITAMYDTQNKKVVLLVRTNDIVYDTSIRSVRKRKVLGKVWDSIASRT